MVVLLISRYLYINRIDMRESRNLSNYTKQQISNSMKKYHASKSEQEKKITRERQSQQMKAYWATIPAGGDINSSVKTCRPVNMPSSSNNLQPTKKI